MFLLLFLFFSGFREKSFKVGMMYVFSITNQTLTCQTIAACQSIVSPGGFGNELTAISAFLSAMLAES